MDRKEGKVKKPSLDNVGVGINLNNTVLKIKKLRRMSNTDRKETEIFIIKEIQMGSVANS